LSVAPLIETELSCERLYRENIWTWVRTPPAPQKLIKFY